MAVLSSIVFKARTSYSSYMYTEQENWKK